MQLIKTNQIKKLEITQLNQVETQEQQLHKIYLKLEVFKFNVVGANGIETSAAGTDVTVKLDAATRGKIDNAADKEFI